MVSFQIEGIDTEAGTKRFAGKEELYKKSLIKFASQYKDAEMPAERDVLKTFAHQIKGVSANLGIDGLSATAAETEKNLESGENLKNALRDVCSLILSKLGTSSNGIETRKSERGGAEEYTGLVAELKNAIKMCNPKQSEALLDKLSRTEWGIATPFDFKKVKSAVERYDFDGAAILLEKAHT